MRIRRRTSVDGVSHIPFDKVSATFRPGEAAPTDDTQYSVTLKPSVAISVSDVV